jgi:hypothetical protein
MQLSEASVILYVVDLDDLRVWIGSKDQRRFNDAMEAIREDEGWKPEELEVLEQLLRRMIFEGKLYEGLDEAERYLVTQILVDLFDEYADPDALSEEIPLNRFLETLDLLPRGKPVSQYGQWLARGRELNGTELLWKGGRDQFFLPYIGYVTRDEAGEFAAALKQVEQQQRGRPSGILRQLRGAAEECARAELDLLAYVG